MAVHMIDVMNLFKFVPDGEILFFKYSTNIWWQNVSQKYILWLFLNQYLLKNNLQIIQSPSLIALYLLYSLQWKVFYNISLYYCFYFGRLCSTLRSRFKLKTIQFIHFIKLYILFALFAVLFSLRMKSSE